MYICLLRAQLFSLFFLEYVVGAVLRDTTAHDDGGRGFLNHRWRSTNAFIGTIGMFAAAMTFILVEFWMQKAL